MTYSQTNDHVVVLHPRCGGRKRKMGELQFGPRSHLIRLNLSISPGKTHQVALSVPALTPPSLARVAHCPCSLQTNT